LPSNFLVVIVWDGVPFFVINDEIILAGAQQPEAFLEAFRQSAS
jgi:predicted DsbA family dithiol-disulfide isomerase